MAVNTTNVSIGTPFSKTAKKVLLLGSGELGKEVAIELIRFGVEVIACDKYENAPAMQVAQKSYVFSMLDGKRLREVVETEKPDLIVPEVEAIATDELLKLEAEGFTVIPTAKATKLTMNREGIRRLAAEELGLKTSNYVFAQTFEEFENAVAQIGTPCVVKPIMSSSGKGQSVIKSTADIKKAWDYSQDGGRSGGGKVIVEGFVDFDYEIALLTVRHKDGTSFCEPIGHQQIDGDYRYSWQPQPMSDKAKEIAQDYAKKITTALGGFGVFGVELFIKGDDVIFNEVSPRPHDTGMVTLISQDLSEFALHVRAILGLSIPNIKFHGFSASAAILAEGESRSFSFENLENALSEPDTALRLFGKTEVAGIRRVGVALARGNTLEEARAKANKVAEKIKIVM